MAENVPETWEELEDSEGQILGSVHFEYLAAIRR